MNQNTTNSTQNTTNSTTTKGGNTMNQNTTTATTKEPTYYATCGDWLEVSNTDYQTIAEPVERMLTRMATGSNAVDLYTETITETAETVTTSGKASTEVNIYDEDKANRGTYRRVRDDLFYKDLGSGKLRTDKFEDYTQTALANLYEIAMETPCRDFQSALAEACGKALTSEYGVFHHMSKGKYDNETSMDKPQGEDESGKPYTLKDIMPSRHNTEATAANRETMKRALQAMSEDENQICSLLLKGYDLDEIAAFTGKSYAATRKTFSRTISDTLEKLHLCESIREAASQTAREHAAYIETLEAIKAENTARRHRQTIKANAPKEAFKTYTENHATAAQRAANPDRQRAYTAHKAPNGDYIISAHFATASKAARDYEAQRAAQKAAQTEQERRQTAAETARRHRAIFDAMIAYNVKGEDIKRYIEHPETLHTVSERENVKPWEKAITSRTAF